MILEPGRRQTLKAYCKLDDDMTPAEELLLEQTYLGAIAYMDGAGVAMPPAGTPRRAIYDSLVDAIVLTNWDRRGSLSEGSEPPENKAWRTAMNQMKLTEPPVSESDTNAKGGAT